MYQKIIISILLSCLCMSVFSAPELKGAPEELRGFLYPKDTLVSMSATAEKTAYSDESSVQIIVSTEQDKLAQSMQKNAELREKIRTFLNEKGIANDNINNSKFSSSPQYGFFGKKPSSYKVVNRVSVLIVQESHLQEIAKFADSHQEVVISGMIFSHSKEEEFNFKVKEEAMARIMREKAYYEKSLGVELQPVRFHENHIGFQPTEGAGMVEEVEVTGMRKKDSFLSQRESYAKQRSSSFDEVKYTATLTVDFKIITTD